MTDKEIQDRITKYDLLFKSRLSKTEQAIDDLREVCKDIKHDMRWGFGLVVGLFGVMFGLMAKGFHWY
jgi:hypothetical protein